MLKTLYPIFQKWSEKGSVYIISDTHFEDTDCKLMDPGWIAPEEQVLILKKYVGKNSTLIHLGDVGNPEWMKLVKGHKVLICGNHDMGANKYADYFDEVYTGPLMISEKIILSHEPISGIDWVLNIHGHDHNPENAGDAYHLNCACNVAGYKPVDLGQVIKSGKLKEIVSLHRQAIEKQKQEGIHKA